MTVNAILKTTATLSVTLKDTQMSLNKLEEIFQQQEIIGLNQVKQMEEIVVAWQRSVTGNVTSKIILLLEKHSVKLTTQLLENTTLIWANHKAMIAHAMERVGLHQQILLYYSKLELSNKLDKQLLKQWIKWHSNLRQWTRNQKLWTLLTAWSLQGKLMTK